MRSTEAAEAEQFQHNHQPDDMARQRFAEPAAVRQDQIALQLGQPIVGDARVGEQPEAGVDAVDRVAAGDDPLDRSGGRRDALHRRVVEAGGLAVPELAQYGQINGGRIEGEHGVRLPDLRVAAQGGAMLTGFAGAP